MKKTAAILLTALLVPSILTLIPLTSAQETAPATITIKTLDGKALQGAIVEIRNATDLIFRGATDQSGRVTPSINYTKTYTIKVFYPPGNLVLNRDFTYETTQSFDVDVLSKWTLRIYDNEGRDPVSDGNVTITFQANNTVTYNGLTDSSGKVIFGPLPAGSYSVKVRFKERNYDGGAHSVAVGSQETTIKLPLFRVLFRVKDVKGLPVENVIISLREELDEEPIATATSDGHGEALLKLVPKSSYYLEASFKEYVVKRSEGRDIDVFGDEEFTITIQAIRLNITVYDADGKEVVSGPQFKLKGELRGEGDTLVAEAETTEGVIEFGHVPLENFTLKVKLGDLVVYSGSYEVKETTGEGSVKGRFYDIVLKANTTGLANQTIAGALSGVLKRGELEFRFEMVGGEGALENVPAADDYTVELYFNDVKVGEVKDVAVSKEDQQITLPLVGYRIEALVTNLKGKPISADVVIALLNGSEVTSFKTGSDGRGVSAPLLPMSYDVVVYFGGIEAGRKTVNLNSDMNITLQASVVDVILRIYDSDQEEALKNVNIQLQSGKFKKSVKSDEEGSALFENIPITIYSVKAWYYGFKVLDSEINVSPGTLEIDLKAPGVLDVRLKFTDSSKKPLDGGLAILSVGDEEVEVEINEHGEARVKNLPNSTIYVKLFYKNSVVEVKPSEFDLRVDESSVAFVARVHSLTVRVVRGDGEPLREGTASVYVNGQPVSTYDLSEENIFSERLPEGEVSVRVEFRDRKVGEKTIYLEEPMKELTVKTGVYALGLYLYYSSGEPAKGVSIVAEDKNGKVGEAVSDETGYAVMLLPGGEYNVRISFGNETLEYKGKLEENTLVNIIYPVKAGMNPVIAAAAAGVALAISALVLVRSLRRGARVARRRRPRRRGGRLPRI